MYKLSIKISKAEEYHQKCHRLTALMPDDSPLYPFYLEELSFMLNENYN